MRENKNRDPYLDYVVIEVIGQGSLGSVEKVRRKNRLDGVGESGEEEARRERVGGATIFGTGGMFRMCCGGESERSDGDGGDNSRPSCWFDALSRFGLRARHDGAFRSMSFSVTDSPSVSDTDTAATPSDVAAATLEETWSLHQTRHAPTKQQSRQYALKSIRLDRTSYGAEAELRNEIDILRSLDHPHIVKSVETYEYRRKIYLVLDLCEGGDLYVLDPYSESEAARIVGQLVGALAFIHRRGIVHRDLKYENVMFMHKPNRKRLNIKLIDFGLSMKYGNNRNRKWDENGDAVMTDFVGTMYTMAPEVIRGNYTYRCDLWSIGVMAYMLLSSQIPFCGKDR